MESGTAFPCRVYCPAIGWFATALSRDSVGVVVRVDGHEQLAYSPAVSVVEVVEESEGLAKLIDGRVVLYGTSSIAGGG